MAETEKPFDIQEYYEMGLRRRWYIIVPLVLSIVASFAIFKRLPKIYRATTLVLVQSSRIPESYIRSTVTDSITERLNTITQEILSRTSLEKVINEFNLYAELRKQVSMEGLVEMMGRAIEVKVHNKTPSEQNQNSFTISYEGKDPRTVTEVTNKLASLFIEENSRVREELAEGTAEFLGKELQTMENQLKKKESDIREFKERHMGQLPQQYDANLRILERQQQQLQTTSENIRAAEDRAVLVRSQIDQLRERERLLSARESRRNSISNSEEIGLPGERMPEDPLVAQLALLKKELGSAQSRYTDNHPDVVDLKSKIAKLEPKVKEMLEKQKAAEEARLKELRARQEKAGDKEIPLISSDPMMERLLAQYTEQYNEAQLEAKRLRGEEKNLREQIALYQRRIEETPKQEQELSLLTRDYDLLKSNYQSLLEKKIQAQMTQNLEHKQKGEQFRVLDPARIPGKPIRPNRDKILLMGAIIGLMSGFGLAWFRESLDRSFHTVEDLEGYLGFPVMATIPNLKEEKAMSRFYYQKSA